MSHLCNVYFSQEGPSLRALPITFTETMWRTDWALFQIYQLVQSRGWTTKWCFRLAYSPGTTSTWSQLSMESTTSRRCAYRFGVPSARRKTCTSSSGNEESKYPPLRRMDCCMTWVGSCTRLDTNQLISH